MRLLVVGAGGHAKVVVDAAQASGIEIAGVVGEPKGRNNLLGVPISETAMGIDADSFIIAVGDNRARAELFAEYVESGMQPAVVTHPSAVIAKGVELGRGTFVAAGVVINVGSRIGDDVILNTSCTIDHDCRVGDHAHVGPTSGVCGGVQIGVGVLIGVGCSIIPTSAVGDWAIVGAGSAVVRDVPAGDVQVGVPARHIKRTEEKA